MGLRVVLAVVAVAGCTATSSAVQVSPDHGRMRGGNDVRVTGAGFAGRGPVAVHVGNKSAKAVVIESSTLVRFKAPQAEVAGVVPLRIAFADGTVIELPEAFTYEEGGASEVLTPQKLRQQ